MHNYLPQEKKEFGQGVKHPVADDFRHIIAEFSWIAVGTVDVDASLLAYNSLGKLLETISFTHPLSEDGSIKHHGDMSTRVAEYESRKEFERIEIDLNKTHEKLHTLVLIVSCHKGSFAKLTTLELKLFQIEKIRSETQEKCVIHSRVDNRFLGENGKWTAAILGDLSRGHMVNAEESSLSESMSNVATWEVSLGIKDGVVVGYANNADQAIPYVKQYLSISQPHMAPKTKGKSYFINRVYDIALKLSPSDLAKLDPLFPENGLNPKDFVDVLLHYFCKKYNELRDLESAVHLVALLQDLFNQIDIQGDGYIAFDEFTDFCVEASNVHTGGELPKCQVDEEVDYTCQPTFGDGRQRSKVLLMRTSNSAEKFLVVREKVPQVQVVDKMSGMVDIALDCTTHTVSLGKISIHPLDEVREFSDTVAMDAIFLPAKKAIAIAATDHHISIWNYTPHSSRASAKYLYSLRARIVQTMIHWAPNKDYEGKKGQIPGYILSVGVDNAISIWDPESRAITQTIRDHPELVNDIMYNRRHGLLMTAGFDRKVRIFEWDKKANRYCLSTVFREKSPLKLLACDSDTLCAVSLECEATCYSLTLRKSTCRLVGHAATIIGVKIVTFIDGNMGIQTRAITCDSLGEVRIWNLSSFNNKEGAADAFFIQQMPPKGSYQSCMIMGARYRAGNIWPDIVISGLGFPMGLIRAVKAKVAQLEASCLLFNDVAEAILAAVGHKILVWDANTSRKTKTFEMPNRSDVNAMAFDHKLQRKLFAGNMNGDIVVFNYVTCRIINSLKVHEAAVSSLRYCSLTNMLISTSFDKRLLVMKEDLSGAGDRYIRRSVTNAHELGIIACDYSEELLLVVTGSKQCIRVWSFQDLSLLGQISSLSAEVVALAFIPGYPLLACADAAGSVSLISVFPCPTPNTILAQLNPPKEKIGSDSPSTSGVIQCLATVLCTALVDEGADSGLEMQTKSIVGGTSKGEIVLWPIEAAIGSLEEQYLVVPSNKEDRLNSEALTAVCKRNGKQLVYHDEFQDQGKVHTNPVPATLLWQGHKDPVLALSAMQNIGLLVSSSGAGEVKMWTAYGCELDYDEKEPGALLGTIGLADKESKKLERELLWNCPAMADGRHQADNDNLKIVAKAVLAKVAKELKNKSPKRKKKTKKPESEDPGEEKPATPEEGEQDKEGHFIGLPELPGAEGKNDLIMNPEDFPEVQRLLRRQRQALHTSHQAKDTHGKVLYGNMYTQLRAGKVGFVESKHPRNRGSKLRNVDISPSPFLQQKLPDIHSPGKAPPEEEARRRRRHRRRDRLRQGELSGSKSAPALTRHKARISTEVEVTEGSFFVTQKFGKDSKMSSMEKKMEATLKTLDDFLAEKNWGSDRDGVFFEGKDFDKELNHDRLTQLQERVDRAIKTPMQPNSLQQFSSPKTKIKPRMTLIERQNQKKATKENRANRRKIMQNQKAKEGATEGKGPPVRHRRRSLYGGKYTRVQIGNIAKVFHQMDRSGDNLISFDEFETFVARNTKESQIFRTLHFSSLDPDNSGVINLSEIIALLFNEATAEEVQRIQAIIYFEMNEMRKREAAQIDKQYGSKLENLIESQFEDDL